MSGPILETWAISELLRSYLHNGKQPPFYYYRDKDKKEIDLVIIRDGTIYPLEIKKTASPTTADVRAFAAIERLGLPVGPGGVICLTQRSLPITSTATSIPIRMV